MEITNYNQKKNSIVFLFLFGFIFLLSDVLGQIQFVRNSIDYIFAPIVLSASKYSNRTKESLAFFSSYSQAESTIAALKNKISQLESQNIGYTTLYDKYNSLLTHQKTSSGKYSYIEAGIYSSDGNYGYILDKGSRDGVEVGNIVVVGNVYIGEIIKVDLKTALIRRPQDVGSSLPVVIVKDKQILKIQTGELNKEIDKNLKAVAVGRNEQVLIENIPNNGFVKNGDIVLVSNPNFGGLLVLGKIDQLLTDSAASVLTSKVITALDIYSIKFVYVIND